MYPSLCLFCIVVETTATLFAEPASIYILLEQPAWSVLGVASVVIENLLDCQTSIQADKVSQSQGTHRHVGAQLHGSIDIFGTCSSLFNSQCLYSIMNIHTHPPLVVYLHFPRA